MADTAFFVQIAQAYLENHQPLIPKNSLENNWHTLAADRIQSVWDEAKELYEKYQNDTMGLLTARRRLAFLYQRSKELEINLM